MSDRHTTERLLRALYEARIGGDLERLCALFAPDATLRISGATDGKPISVTARGSEEIRTWLATLVKTFKISSHQMLTSVGEDAHAAVHWRCKIHSRITGAVVVTELMDFFEIRADQIHSYVEFFVPC